VKLPPLKDVVAAAQLVGAAAGWLVRLLRPDPPATPKRAPGELSHRDAEIQAEAARRAGPPCTRPPPGWVCSRMRGHEGPCAARLQEHR
jgi:hypothetical protein